jgi:hypothetical protein
MSKPRQRPVKGESEDWYTPPHVFEQLGLVFDLDPASPPGGLPWIPAARHYSRADDGLAQPWEGRVWMNPPYGADAAGWLGRLTEHYESGNGDGVALIFARTDVAWWHEVVPRASAVCFLRGRLQFIDHELNKAPGAAAAPSALIAFGEECADAVAASGLGMTFGVERVVSSGRLW